MNCSKVLVLGGCGAMGRPLARTLADFDFVEHIIIAGLDSNQGRRFSQSLQGKGEFLALDVRDELALSSAIQACDLVVNAVGPFYQFAKLIVTAAINQKRPYIDICDDIEPTETILSKHEDAKNAGIPMVCGLGASPGLTNILARMAANKLDLVHELDTVWDISGTNTVEDEYSAPTQNGQPSAALVHWMHCCSGNVKVLENGNWASIKPLEPISLAMPNETDTIGWTVAHPEPLTLAKTFQDLQASHNYMTGPAELFKLLQSVRDRFDAGDLTP